MFPCVANDAASAAAGASAAGNKASAAAAAAAAGDASLSCKVLVKHTARDVLPCPLAT